jgi:uncharacterized protein (TIGR02231 family)
VLLSYVVPNATWEVAYQLRAEPASSRVTLLAKAIIAQGTGEDWENAALSVSTANLTRSNIPPRLQRLAVSTFEPEDKKKVLTRRFEQREHLKQGTSVAASTPSGREQAESAEPDLGLSMLLPAAEKAKVPSDGRRVTVTLASRTFSAEHALETVPKLYPFVYHRLRIFNPFPFVMLPGPMELFEGGAFVGTSSVKMLAPKEPAAIAFGVDQQVIVERFLKKEELEAAGALGSKKKLHHRYVIEVGNWTTAARQIQVLENIPVSRDKEIQISLDDDATRPSDWNTVDGIMSYKLSIPPRNKKRITVAYTVTLPDSYDVSGY